MARNKFNEAGMFNMLTGIDRAIKSEAYKKYDLPTFDKGGKTGEEPPAKGAKKKAYQDAITANVYDYLKRTNYKTPHVPGKTIDDLGREMNCIHGVCQIVEGTGAKKFSQEYFGNMIFDDNMKKEGFYYAQPETEGFEIGDFLRFARTKGNANSLARYSGSVNPLNEDDLIPQHTSFILDKYVDDNGVTMYSVANNHGEENVETTEIPEQELLEWAQKGKGSFDKMLIARYDPDKVAEDAEKSEKINKILSGENPYASKYSGRKPGVKLKEKDELAEELLGYYKKNYEKLGKSSDLPPEVLDKLFVKQIGIAKQESTTGGRSIGKSMVPEPMLPYARKIADALFDNDNWILDYWNKNADAVKSKFKSIKEFTDYVTKDLKLDKEAREYLRYNSPASKGMFQQKELSQRGRFHKSGFDIPEEQFISSMDLAIDNYHKLKDKYPDMFEPELVELTTLMHNSPFKALTPEYVNYYLKNQDIDYVNKVNNYIPAYDIDRPVEKETELQKFIQKYAKPLPITETANTVSPEEKKKIVNFLLNQNKKKEYGGELESFQDGGKKKNTPSKDMKDLQTLPEFNVISAVPGSKYENTLKYLQILEDYNNDENKEAEPHGAYALWDKYGKPAIEILDIYKPIKRGYFDSNNNVMHVPDEDVKYIEDLEDILKSRELDSQGNLAKPFIDIQSFLAELAHAKQLKDNPFGKYGMEARAMIDWFKSPYFTAYMSNEPSQYEEGALWGKGQYDTPGTIEYEAHKEIEPTLKDEFEKFKNTQLNYKIDVLKKQYGGSTKYGNGGKTSPPKKNIAVLGVRDGSSKKYNQNIFIQTLKDYERDIEKGLGNPMQKAQDIKKSEPLVTPGTPYLVNPLRLTPEQIEQRELQDNERHSAAGYYTAKAITDKFPEWSQYTGIPQAIGALGSIGLGIGHETISNKYTRPHENDPYTKWNVLREGLEDATNNTVGAFMNVIPFMSESEKIEVLKYMSDNNMLPDGVDQPSGKNQYWKNEKGEINKPYKKKQHGGLAKFVDGGGKKGTKENPFELPEITITPDTKRQAEMAEMYKYMPEDVKQAIAYDMENPDTLTESPEEQSYLSRGFDAITHPFAALGELHNRRGLQSNWLELNQERLGPNFLDWALYGAAAARFLPQAAKELPKYLSSSLPGMSKIPGATLGNALASEMIVNSALRETGLKGEEDPSTVREWEKYAEDSQDLGTTIANTGWNAMDALAFGELGPLKSQLAKDAGAIGEYLTTQTPLKETWRLNPKAYQYNLPENAMWRGLGQEGYEDAIASDLFRSKQNVIPEYYPGTRLQLNKSFGINPYFTPKFKTAATYGDKYLAEVPKDVANWTQRYARTDWSQVADRPIPISEGKILQKDWLRGYKQVNAPKASSRPVMQNSFPTNEIPEGESITGEAGSTTEGVKPKLEEIKLENVNYRVDPQTGEDYLEIPVWQKRFAKDGTSGIQLQNEKLMEFTDKPKSTLKIEEPAPRDIIEGHEKEFELAKEFGYKWAMPDPKETFNIRGMLEQALQDVDLNKKYIDAKHASMKSPRVSTVEYNKYINEERPILEQNLQKSIAKAEELQKMLYNSIDPEFKAKVRNLMTESGVVNTEALEYPFHIEHMNPDRAALVNIINNDKGFANLSSVDKDFVIKNYPSFSGVRTDDAAITIGTRPSNYEAAYVKVPVPKNWEPGQSANLTAADVDLSNAQLVRRTRQDYPLPEAVGRTTAHEIGHDLQKYFDWNNLIVEHDPAYKYFVNKDDTNISRLFKESLVDPTPAVDGKKTYETWKASGMELHSDLMMERYELAKSIMEQHKVSLNTAIDHVKYLERIEDPTVINYYLESPDITKHFKETTSDAVKKQIIKILPAAAPFVFGTGAALSEDKKKLPENKFGGNISNLQKFTQ